MVKHLTENHKEMKEYQYITIGSIGIGTGYILSRYV